MSCHLDAINFEYLPEKSHATVTKFVAVKLAPKFPKFSASSREDATRRCPRIERLFEIAMSHERKRQKRYIRDNSRKIAMKKQD